MRIKETGRIVASGVLREGPVAKHNEWFIEYATKFIKKKRNIKNEITFIQLIMTLVNF